LRKKVKASGSIPAQAGEPFQLAKESESIGVHPRAGGGAAGLHIEHLRNTGPSPRRRGSPNLLNLAAHKRRSIPAQVGGAVPACERK
jgi:hypothetical protein